MATSPPYELLRSGQTEAYFEHVNLKLAGSDTYGNWRKNFVVVDHLPPFIHAFVDQARQMAIDRSGLSVLDAGCGNGTFGLPVVIHVAEKTNVPIHATFLDKQLEAIDEVDQYLSTISLPTLLHTQSMCQDIKDADIPEHSLDVIILKNLLHFIDPEITAQVLDKLYRALRPGGIMYIDVCSVFNPCAVGFENKKHFLDMLVLLRQKHRTLPHTSYNSYFQKMMYFHTPSSIALTLENAGFSIVNLHADQNLTNPNGWGPQYPENLWVIARKIPESALIKSTLFSLN